MYKKDVDHIPVIWAEPRIRRGNERLVFFLPHFTGTKESTIPYLQELADRGCIAVSFDPWEHGARGVETPQEMVRRVFGNYKRYMWTIMGQTAIDLLRVLDWAFASFKVLPEVYAAGLSMGGDIAVAAAGVEPRIRKVVAVVATPDWNNPGMEDLFKPGTLLPAGEADRYAQFFYDTLNPFTHIERYRRQLDLLFLCGEKDSHVPSTPAFEFQGKLKDCPEAKVDVELISDLQHLDVKDAQKWWPQCFARLMGPQVA